LLLRRKKNLRAKPPRRARRAPPHTRRGAQAPPSSRRSACAFLAMSSSSCPALGPKLVPSVTELNLSSTAPWQPHVHDRGDGRRSSVHPFMYWPRDLDSHEGLQALRDTILAQQFPRDPSACNSTTRCSNPAPVPACYASAAVCTRSRLTRMALSTRGWPLAPSREQGRCSSTTIAWAVASDTRRG
jgi:hypothetical protein